MGFLPKNTNEVKLILTPYGKTKFLSKGFKDKDELQNPVVPPFVMEGDFTRNPFATGSTRKRIWNYELMILTLGARTDDGATLPGKDVSDTKLSLSTPKDGDMTLNWPAEGYHSFGGRTGGPFEYRVSK